MLDAKSKSLMQHRLASKLLKSISEQEPKHILEIDMLSLTEIGALFDENRNYRFSLYRVWEINKPLVTFIGLNPSTATATTDDPTIRRCKAHAANLGAGGMIMTNLFALRATDPKDMIAAGDKAVQWFETNQRIIKESCLAASTVICAWGKHGNHMNMAEIIHGMLLDEGLMSLKAFRTNKDGTPKHPLYVADNTPLIDYNPIF